MSPHVVNSIFQCIQSWNFARLKTVKCSGYDLQMDSVIRRLFHSLAPSTTLNSTLLREHVQAIARCLYPLCFRTQLRSHLGVPIPLALRYGTDACFSHAGLACLLSTRYAAFLHLRESDLTDFLCNSGEVISFLPVCQNRTSPFS